MLSEWTRNYVYFTVFDLVTFLLPVLAVELYCPPFVGILSFFSGATPFLNLFWLGAYLLNVIQRRSVYLVGAMILFGIAHSGLVYYIIVKNDTSVESWKRLLQLGANGVRAIFLFVFATYLAVYETKAPSEDYKTL